MLNLVAGILGKINCIHVQLKSGRTLKVSNFLSHKIILYVDYKYKEKILYYIEQKVSAKKRALIDSRGCVQQFFY